MFGKRTVAPAPLQFASEPRRSHAGPEGPVNQGIDATLAELSETLGLDLDFGPAFILAPSHWQIPEVGSMLRTLGMEPTAKGNRLALLKSPASVAKLNRLPQGDPLRAMLERCGFGLALYDPHAENGCSDDLAKMQAEVLKGIVANYPNAEARRYAVLDFLSWSEDVLKGKIKI